MNRQLATFVPYAHLDLAQYDACVLASGCPVPYALSAYLYAVAVDSWGAWVWPDEHGRYRAVMPLVQGRKWGLVPYGYMPPFVQRLGVFALPGQEPSSDEIQQAWQSLRRRNARLHYSFWQQPDGIATQPRQNQILDLNEDYPTLAARYSGGLKDNLRKGRSLTIRPTQGGGISWRLFTEQVAPRLPDWSERHNRAWVRLYTIQSPHFRFLHLGAFKDDKAILPDAAASFCLYRNRMIYLMGAGTPEGRASGAMARLLDQAIRDRAGSGFVLDFEGGAMAGTGQFFRSFGAAEEAYFARNKEQETG